MHTNWQNLITKTRDMLIPTDRTKPANQLKHMKQASQFRTRQSQQTAALQNDQYH